MYECIKKKKILGKFFVREWLLSTVGWRRPLASKVCKHQFPGAWEGRLRKESFKTCLGFYVPIPDIWYWLFGELGHHINVYKCLHACVPFLLLLYNKSLISGSPAIIPHRCLPAQYYHL